MLKEWDRIPTSCCVREHLDGFGNGSRWTEVDEMLVTDCEAGSRAVRAFLG